jgi:SOS response regulatory protein OraA/RecX
VIETTMASLVRLQLIDDIEFAQAWVAGRRGYGPARLRQELRRKGIERSLAEDVITTGLSEEDEYASARQVAARALRGHALPPERAELLRVRRMLMRRGFSCAVIGRVCASLSPRACEDGDWLE